MDGILDGEESDERGKAPPRGYIRSYVFMDKILIEPEYILTSPSLEELASDRHTGSGDDRHISVESKLSKLVIGDDE